MRKKLGEVDEKQINNSKNRIKLSYDNEKKNRFFFERLKRQT